MAKSVEAVLDREVKGQEPFVNPLADADPLGDRVLVRRLLPKKQTESGIFLPDSSWDYMQELGVVVRVGPGKRDESAAGTGQIIPVTCVRPGQRVVIPKYAGHELKGIQRTEIEYVIVRAEEILATLPD